MTSCDLGPPKQVFRNFILNSLDDPGLFGIVTALGTGGLLFFMIQNPSELLLLLTFDCFWHGLD